MQKKINLVDSKKKKENHNIEIVILSSFFIFLFICMMVYVGYFVATNEQEMVNNSYNSRQEIFLSKNYRGSIYAVTGEVLAYTKLSESDGTETRVYPYGELFSHVIGYSSFGRMGVEHSSNFYLINSNIPLSQKATNETEGKKNPGDNVYTTLDVGLQEVASRSLGIYKGAIIVSEVTTGKILAMLSQPDFDPNEISHIWSQVTADTESSVLLNRTTQGLYPPGSTFKIISALEYIRENTDTYNSYTYTCNGFINVDGNRINCYHGISHGNVSLLTSFAQSCNTSFANIGLNLNMTKFSKTLDDLYFNRDLSLDFPSSKSYVLSNKDLSIADKMQLSIGQGTTQMSPLHLNMITSSIANKGVAMTPYVVDYVATALGEIISTTKPKKYDTFMSEKEANELKNMMTEVVKTGTATKLSGYSYDVAGKTGSAEYNSNADSHAWFTGFAPIDNPQICVTVILEGAGSGGEYAVPIARRIFDAYFSE